MKTRTSRESDCEKHFAQIRNKLYEDIINVSLIELICYDLLPFESSLKSINSLIADFEKTEEFECCDTLKKIAEIIKFLNEHGK